MKKVIFYLLICLLVVFLGLLGILYFWPDKSSVNDYDLRLGDRVIPKEENAYFDWKQASDLMINDKTNYDLINNYLTGKTGKNNEIDVYLEKNKEALILLEEGFSKKYYQNPEFEYYKDNVNEVSEVVGMKIIKLGFVKMKKLLNSGKNMEALEYGEKLYKIGQMLQEAQDSIVQKSVGGVIKRQLNEQVVSLYASKLKQEEIEYWLKIFDKYPDKIENEKSGEKIGYLVVKNSIKNNLSNGFHWELCRKIVGNELASSFCYLSEFGFYWQPNATINYLADFTRFRIDNNDKNYNELKEYDLKPDLASGWLADYRTENVVGKTWMASYVKILTTLGIVDEDYQSKFEQKAYKLILLLKKYELENGKLPESLEKIISSDRRDVLDPYNGSIIHYDSIRRVIYSVGKDLQDDGGDKEKDIVFQF